MTIKKFQKPLSDLPKFAKYVKDFLGKQEAWKENYLKLPHKKKSSLLLISVIGKKIMVKALGFESIMAR